MNFIRTHHVGIFGVLLAVSLIGSAAGQVNTWTGSGNWTNASNWSLTHVPEDNEDIVINGNVLLTNSPALLASFTVNAGNTHTFGGWDTVLTASVVTVNGTITHLQNSATNTTAGQWIPDSRIAVSCNTMCVASGGWVNANGTGYRGGELGATTGRGPGGGVGVSSSAGHGGFGGTQSGAGGSTYGSETHPVDPGSGGGGWGKAVNEGGYGGGAIQIVATGAMIVNGMVSANGDKGYANNTGAGSGGSIYILCGTFEGTNGSLQAMGGDRQIFSNSSGGGGRIAVIYTNTAAQGVPSVLFSTAPGREANTRSYSGDIGTLYFPDSRFLSEIVTHSGQWMAPSFTNWAVNSLTISNAWIRFPASDFSLTVTNSLTVLGGYRPYNRLDLTPTLIHCGGDLVLTNITDVTEGSYLYLLASTNSVPEADGCGPRVAVGGSATLSTNSVLYPSSNPTNGCGIGFEMQNLTISAGGSINADTLGYQGGMYAGDSGKGPGGTASGSFSGGGGYGGLGGAGNPGAGGMTYGSSNAPVHSGSGNGYNTWSQPSPGRAGGGLVRLIVQNLVLLNGTITANGGSASIFGGGSSGGGIYIHCHVFAGSGALFAKGGNGSSAHGGGGGGGGRIAVSSLSNTSTLSATNVSGGTGATAPGLIGTIAWEIRPPSGTMISIR